MYTNAQVALLAAAAQDTKEERIITRAEVFLIWLNKQSQATVDEFAASQGIDLDGWTRQDAQRPSRRPRGLHPDIHEEDEVDEELPPTHYLTRDLYKGHYICGGCRFDPIKQGLAKHNMSALHAVRQHVSAAAEREAQKPAEDEVAVDVSDVHVEIHTYMGTFECSCGYNPMDSYFSYRPSEKEVRQMISEHIAHEDSRSK